VVDFENTAAEETLKRITTGAAVSVTGIYKKQEKDKALKFRLLKSKY
jgi:hypothetical protein